MVLETGIRGHAETVVDRSNIASSVGSGLLDVFSTPGMIALMEKTCMESVAPCLEEGQGTVGIRIEADHLAAVPLGETVRAESELTAVDGRVLTFSVTVWSDKEKIGEAIHKRCIISSERFLEKLSAKYGK